MMPSSFILKSNISIVSDIAVNGNALFLNIAHFVKKFKPLNISNS